MLNASPNFTTIGHIGPSGGPGDLKGEKKPSAWEPSYRSHASSHPQTWHGIGLGMWLHVEWRFFSPKRTYITILWLYGTGLKVGLFRLEHPSILPLLVLCKVFGCRETEWRTEPNSLEVLGPDSVNLCQSQVFPILPTKLFWSTSLPANLPKAVEMIVWHKHARDRC